MQRQTIYASFTTRLFASTIDITIFSILLMPISTLFSNKMRHWCLHNFLVSKNINTDDVNAVTDYFMRNISHLTNAELSLFFTYTFFSLVYSFIIIGICYITCWMKWYNTPGKMLLRIKIVDAKNLSIPNRQQFIRRYLSYIFGFLNIFIMPFSARNRGIQDILSNTVVIKM